MSTSAETKPETEIGLGDCVEAALSAVGVTPERVTAWLGFPCLCAERKAALNRWRIKRNRLKVWAARYQRGKATAGQLEEIIASSL